MSIAEATGAGAGVMDRLRNETAALHASAEGKAIQQAMVRGAVTREAYIAWMREMLHLHVGLERALRDLRASDARVRELVSDDQFRAGDIREDLVSFGTSADDGAAPRPATKSGIGAIERGGLAVLGMHYVLEGSLNGNRFIAKAIRGSMRLPDGRGTKHLDPYGEAQREKWAAFKRTMDAQAWTPAEQDTLVEGAKAMFGAIAAMSDEAPV